jgi:hypothetical protein
MVNFLSRDNYNTKKFQFWIVHDFSNSFFVILNTYLINEFHATEFFFRR